MQHREVELRRPPSVTCPASGSIPLPKPCLRTSARTLSGCEPGCVVESCVPGAYRLPSGARIERPATGNPGWPRLAQILPQVTVGLEEDVDARVHRRMVRHRSGSCSSMNARKVGTASSTDRKSHPARRPGPPEPFPRVLWPWRLDQARPFDKGMHLVGGSFRVIDVVLTTAHDQRGHPDRPQLPVRNTGTASLLLGT